MTKLVSRRDDLLGAAAQEFLLNGYAGASFSSIAQRLDLTKGALAFHFKTKQSIADAMVDELLDAIAQIRRQVAIRFPEGGLRALIMFLLLLGFANERDIRVSAGVRLCYDPSAPDETVYEPLSTWKQTIADYTHQAYLLNQITGEYSPDAAAEFLTVTTLGISAASPRLDIAQNTARLRFVRISLNALGAQDADAIIDQIVDELTNLSAMPKSYFYETRAPQTATSPA